MKKWLLAAAVCVLTACSSGGESKTYYQLPVVQGGAQSAASQGARLLWVEQVSIPDYLAGNGVVYQTTDVQYVIANNNLWASPLDQQLRNYAGGKSQPAVAGLGSVVPAAGERAGYPQRCGQWLSWSL